MASTTVKPPGGPAAPPPGDGGGGKKPLGIAGATGLMMATVLLSRILGVLRDALIAKYFGRGPQTDAYNAAFTVPDLLFYLLQSGALSSTDRPDPDRVPAAGQGQVGGQDRLHRRLGHIRLHRAADLRDVDQRPRADDRC